MWLPATPPAAAARIADICRSMISAGDHLAPSVQEAEVPKVFENTQRDFNIALTNELALIFGPQELHTTDVLARSERQMKFASLQARSDRRTLNRGESVRPRPLGLSLGFHPEAIFDKLRTNGIGTQVAERALWHRHLGGPPRPYRGRPSARAPHSSRPKASASDPRREGLLPGHLLEGGSARLVKTLGGHQNAGPMASSVDRLPQFCTGRQETNTANLGTRPSGLPHSGSRGRLIPHASHPHHHR